MNATAEQITAALTEKVAAKIRASARLCEVTRARVLEPLLDAHDKLMDRALADYGVAGQKKIVKIAISHAAMDGVKEAWRENDAKAAKGNKR